MSNRGSHDRSHPNGTTDLSARCVAGCHHWGALWCVRRGWNHQDKGKLDAVARFVSVFQKIKQRFFFEFQFWPCTCVQLDKKTWQIWQTAGAKISCDGERSVTSRWGVLTWASHTKTIQSSHVDPLLPVHIEPRNNEETYYTWCVEVCWVGLKNGYHQISKGLSWFIHQFIMVNPWVYHHFSHHFMAIAKVPVPETLEKPSRRKCRDPEKGSLEKIYWRPLEWTSNQWCTMISICIHVLIYIYYIYILYIYIIYILL